MTIFPASCAECCPSQLQTLQLSIPVQQEALEATVLVLIGEKRSIKWVDGKQMVIYPLWLQFKSNTLNFVYSSNFFRSFSFFSCSSSSEAWQILPKSGWDHTVNNGDVDVGWWGQVSSALSAKILLCRVSHIFSFLVVALVVWFILMTFVAGGALLPMVGTLLVRSRCSGLQRGEPKKKCFITRFSFDIQHNTWMAGKKNALICFYCVFSNHGKPVNYQITF